MAPVPAIQNQFRTKQYKPTWKADFFQIRTKTQNPDRKEDFEAVAIFIGQFRFGNDQIVIKEKVADSFKTPIDKIQPQDQPIVRPIQRFSGPIEPAPRGQKLRFSQICGPREK